MPEDKNNSNYNNNWQNEREEEVQQIWEAYWQLSVETQAVTVTWTVQQFSNLQWKAQ